MSRYLALRRRLVRLGFALGRLLPVRRRVVLATAHGSRISGNLAWIRGALRAEHPDLHVVVIASLPGGGRRRYLLNALRAIRAGFQLATARLFVVDDYYFPMYVIEPRPGTTFVQVWHACGAFKKFGYSVLDKSFGADEAYVREVDIHSNYDLCLVSSTRFTSAYAEAFGLPADRFTSHIGIPRTDLFFDAGRSAAAIERVRRRYAIPEGKRTILYAPTFRGEKITLARDPDALDFDLLARELGADHVLLLRSHPFVAARRGEVSSQDPFVIDVSDYPDINELMLVSDVLLTDYSSAMYEFALTGRPIAFHAPDFAAYEAERGFYFDYRTGVPGPVFTTTDEVAAWLREEAFDVDRVRRFAAESFDAADGHATSRFITEVVLPALAADAPGGLRAP